MWIRCKCGNIIHDNTNNLSYKGHIISDKEYFKLLDLLDKMIESPAKNRENLIMTYRANLSGYIKIKLIFQCSKCGRIFIEDENNRYCSFIPDEHEKIDLLNFNGNDKIDYKYKSKK